MSETRVIIAYTKGPRATAKPVEVLVDADQHDALNHYTWRIGKDGYVYRRYGRVGIRMHRYLLNAQPGTLVDHINGNPLDNRLANLREATYSENARNRRGQANTSSQYKGVTLHKPTGRWQAAIKAGSKRTYLGLFETEEAAARAYDAAAVAFGAFARLNFPQGGSR